MLINNDIKRREDKDDHHLRLDKEFAQELRELSFERAKRGIDPRPSTPKLTRDIPKCPSWGKVKEELVKDERRKDRLPNLFFDKRGYNIGTLFVFMAVAFIFAISLIIIIFFVNNLAESFRPIAQSLNTSQVDAVDAYNKTIGMLPAGYSVMRWASFAIIFAMILSIFISAALANNHPVVFVPFVLVAIVAIVFSVGISNAYEKIMQDPILAPTFAQYAEMNWLFLNLPMIIIIMGVVGAALIAINIFREPGGYYG